MGLSMSLNDDNNIKNKNKDNTIINDIISSGVNNDFDMFIYIDCSKSNSFKDGTNNHDIPASFPKISNHILINPYIYILHILRNFFIISKNNLPNILLYFFGTSYANKTKYKTEKITSRYDHSTNNIINVNTNNCKTIDELISAYVSGIYSIQKEEFRNKNDCNSYSDNSQISNIIDETIESVKNTNKYTILFILTDGYIHDDIALYKKICDLSYYPVSLIYISINNEFDNNQIVNGIQSLNYKTLEISKKEFIKMQKRRKFNNFSAFFLKDIIKRQLISSELRNDILNKIFEDIPFQYNYIQKSDVLNYKPSFQKH